MKNIMQPVEVFFPCHDIEKMTLKKQAVEKEKRRRKKKSRKNKYCKYCGVELTPENTYIRGVCNDKECRKKKLVICDEDCLNCKYDDCMINEKGTKNYSTKKYKVG